MNWYVAHIIMYVEFKDGNQDKYPVWDNLVLFRATSHAEALRYAAQRGRSEQGDSNGSFRWDGREATWRFAEVRETILCDGGDSRPNHGTEVAYLQLEFSDDQSLRKFARGANVVVTFDNVRC